jgi:hypothetical protein
MATRTPFDHTHSLWTQTLEIYLNKEGLFAYKRLHADIKTQKKSAFVAYLENLGHVSKYQFEKFTRNEQMAFLINAYNALTIKLIIDHYPVQSIKKIGSFFSSPWKKKFFSLLDDSVRTLDQIEHEWLRSRYKDFRIHAAVNCASISCPGLGDKAFTSDDLDQQLDDQMQKWLSDTSRNRLDPTKHIAYVSKIFDWYQDDFESWGGGVKRVLETYKSNQQSDFFKTGCDYSIAYLDYNWDLNEEQGKL